MAIELNSSLKNAVPDISPRTVPPSLNTDVKKVSPEHQEKLDPRHEVSEAQTIPVSEPSVEELDVVVAKLNDYVEQQKRGISFSIDEDTSKTVVKLLDSNGDVLKQIPSEEVLAILRSIESNKGLFLQDEA